MTLADRIADALERPPLSQVAGAQRDELLELAASADAIEDLPGKWQAAILQAESSGPASPGACGCSAPASP